jgi:DNA-binding CsgD family transcriptional regulator
VTRAPAELIGRTRECRSLAQLLDAVRHGQSRVLVVRGEAGIGKSALLQHLVGAASGFRVLHATGVESEMELPFAALHQLCAPLQDLIDPLPEPQRAAATTAFGLETGTYPDRLLIGLAVLSLLSTAADDGPLLCVVDDAHWLDRASAQALAFVARRLLADRVGLVFATRRATTDLVALPELAVEGLQDADAHTLLRAVLRVPLDARVRDRIVAETHGNPLALVEWPRGLTSAELAGGFGMPSLLPMAGQLEESFRRRLTELPETTRRFLTVAAAEPTGDPVIVWRAAGMLGLGPHDAVAAIDAGLVEVGVRVWFRHPVVRTVVYESAAIGDRRAAHRALAQATDLDLDPDRRAWHGALGSAGPDEDIAEALEHSAGRARARGGLAAAGALLERSVALTRDPTRRGTRILAASADHLEAGSFEIAAGLLASAEAAALDELGRAQLDMLRGRHASAGGDVRDAPALLLRAARRLEPLDAGVAADAYLQAMGAAVLAGSFARGAGIDDVARAVGTRPAPAAPTLGERLVVELARAAVDGLAAAAPALKQVLEATTTDAITTVPFYGLGFLGGVASLLWDLDALQRLTALHVTATRDIGALTMLPWALNTVALLRTLDGDLDGAATMVAEANQIVEATGGNIGIAWSGAILAGWRADGDAPKWVAALAEKGRAAGNAQAFKHAQWGSAILHNGRGEHDRALAAGTEALLQPADWGTHMFFHEVVEAAARCGKPAVGAAALERLRETSEPSGTDWAIGIQRRSEALLAPDPAAEDVYREAIDRLARTSLRPELARAHLLYGEWLRNVDRTIDARAPLRTAHEMFSAMGAHAFTARARRELLAAGESVRKRARDTFDELTTQEAHIARLAADGHTNPEIGAQLFISPRTVEWHLRKVFTKLGVTSRRGLHEALPRKAG